MDALLQSLIAAVASFLFVSFLSLGIVLLCRPRKKTHSQALTPTSRPQAALLPFHFPCDENATFDPSLHQISMSELAAATGNFSAECIVGDGSFGFVYKARLSNGVTVAVKKLSADAFHGFREFRAEMETLGRIRHRNLARILGYCISGSDRVLIYEFLERGSLDQWLHDTSPHDPLPWAARLQVIRGVASGLAFLHDDCKPCIIHRDIKASNVLLDANFEARIADFGLARRVDSLRSHVSTQVAGTMGYMPPEYRDGQTAATVKADVYSFGILMFELATGKRPNWPITDGGKEVCLIQWVRRMVEENRGVEILDPLIERQGLSVDEVNGFLKIAYRCSSECGKDRPLMEEVVSLLNHSYEGNCS